MLSNNYKFALEVKEGKSIHFPSLPDWNPAYPLYPYQERGVAYLYLARKAILADCVGLGKTIQMLALISLLKTTGKPYHTLVLAPNVSVQRQWRDEIHKFIPSLVVVSVEGEKSTRVRQIATRWEILLSRYPLLLRDLPYLQSLDFDILVGDESSCIRHHNTKTARAVKALTRGKQRVILLDATPIQNSLADIHSQLETFHLKSLNGQRDDDDLLDNESENSRSVYRYLFGSESNFVSRYIRQELTTRRARGGRTFTQARIIGYKNMEEFKEALRPFILRRNLQEIEAELPAVTSSVEWLELPTYQRKLYTEARQSLLSLLDQSDRLVAPEQAQDKINIRIRIRAHLHSLLQACDSAYALDPNSSESVKADWIVRNVRYSLSGQKVLIFCKYLKPLAHIIQKLSVAGITTCRFTGEDSNEARQAALDAFRQPMPAGKPHGTPDSPQVLIGTSALERGLNLQVSCHLIAVSELLNPQRMQQILGRIHRIGSEHKTVHMTTLLAEDTIEARFHRLLTERAAVSGYVFDEKSEIFESLSDNELADIIRQ